MKLYIVRHGQAELSAGQHIEEMDRQRALTTEGHREAQAAGQHLREALAGEIPFVVVSPYRRAQETAQEILPLLDLTWDAAITIDSITPRNSAKEALAALQAYENKSILVMIGHQPLISQLIAQLVWQKDEPSIAMGTAYVACLDVETLSVGGAELLWIKSPRLFGNA